MFDPNQYLCRSSEREAKKNIECEKMDYGFARRAVDERKKIAQNHHGHRQIECKPENDCNGHGVELITHKHTYGCVRMVMVVTVMVWAVAPTTTWYTQHQQSVCISRMFLNVDSDVRDEQAGVWAMRSMHATMNDVCNRLLSHIVYTQATLLQHRHDWCTTTATFAWFARLIYWQFDDHRGFSAVAVAAVLTFEWIFAFCRKSYLIGGLSYATCMQLNANGGRIEYQRANKQTYRKSLDDCAKMHWQPKSVVWGVCYCFGMFAVVGGIKPESLINLCVCELNF